MNRSLKIFLACALGALVGSLVALESNHYFWWVGLLAGGLIGYLSYEFGAVVRAIATAWQKTFGNFRLAWRKGWLVEALVMVCLGINVLIVSKIVVILITWLTPAEPLNIGIFGSPVFSWFSLPGALLVAFVSFKSVLLPEFNLSKSRLFLRQFNPLSVFVYYPLYGLWRAIMHTPAFARWLGSRGPALRLFSQRVMLFVKRVFVQIHSDIRLLCAIDAAVGAGLGYSFESVIIGAVCGGLFGVLNYQVVTKWLLKLEHNGTSA